jgi:large subunit ribosomal protein L29
MTLPKYKELNNFNTLEEVDNEIFLFQKKLFELKIEKATRRSNQSHLFTHIKHRIAQLKFKRSSLAKTMKLY